MKTIAIKDVYALRDIKRGEELTPDYTATSVISLLEKDFGKKNANVEAKIAEKHYMETSSSCQISYKRNTIQIFHLP